MSEEAEDVVMAEVPVGNPEGITKNPNALKEAYKEMAVLDVLVCGNCNAVFHFVKNFEEHKEEGCTGESPIKDINEREAQIWAFLLWKCSSAPEGSDVSHNNSWKLYQQWCRMPMPHRTAWITAGTNVLSTSKFSHARVTEIKTDDQQVPVQVPATGERKRGRPRKVKIEGSEAGDDSDFSSPLKKANVTKKQITPQALHKLRYDESVRNAQERVPPEERVARRTERDGENVTESGEFIVEKILAKRFNPRVKHYEFLLKWEGYPHEQNTWEPVENLGTCKNLLEAFEKQLARQKELKALKAQMEAQGGQQPVKVKQVSTPIPQLLKQNIKKETPTYTPTGRLQRSSKARALDQVKAWCGATDDESTSIKKFKKETSSDDEDYSESAGSGDDIPTKISKLEKREINGQRSPKGSVDAELVKKLGLSGKGMPNIKGVIKVDPKQIPNLSSGVYIMSKSSGIIKLDSPGKPGSNIDQDAIRKQILAAKQARKTANTGEQVTEKTIITPSGQKIIQRTIQRSPTTSAGKSPVTILNRKLGLQGETSIIRRGASSGRGRGRGATAAGYSITTASGNVIKLREKNPSISFDFESDASSDTSDGLEDPFPSELGPIPEPSPDRELTLCPLTGKRLARAENEPTPPPTPSPPPTPCTTSMVMKVEMSPGGTTGMLIQGDAQPSLPMLTDEDGTEVKVEASAVKQLLEEGVDEGEVSLLHTGGHPIMIRGEDGVLYQVTGENEDGETMLVPAEGVEGVEGTADGDGEGVMYVTREDSQDEILTLDPSQLAHLLPGEGGAPLQQVTVQVEGENGEDATQVVAQLVHADLPSPGGTRRVVLLLPDGSFTMTELDKEQFDSITENNQQE